LPGLNGGGTAAAAVPPQLVLGSYRWLHLRQLVMTLWCSIS